MDLVCQLGRGVVSRLQSGHCLRALLALRRGKDLDVARSYRQDAIKAAGNIEARCWQLRSLSSWLEAEDASAVRQHLTDVVDAIAQVSEVADYARAQRLVSNGEVNVATTCFAGLNGW